MLSVPNSREELISLVSALEGELVINQRIEISTDIDVLARMSVRDLRDRVQFLMGVVCGIVTSKTLDKEVIHAKRERRH